VRRVVISLITVYKSPTKDEYKTIVIISIGLTSREL